MAKNEYRDEIERLTALLADRDEREAKIARERDEARIERDAMADVLPGHYYMDPPDGGDVPVLEQLRRMAKDAERYRWLRRKCAATGRAAVRERSGGDAAVSGRRQDGLQGADLTSSPA